MVSLLHDGSAGPMAWVIAAASGLSLLGQAVYGAVSRAASGTR
jgi:hypothetical protein